jgi:hypothetical protein
LALKNLIEILSDPLWFTKEQEKTYKIARKLITNITLVTAEMEYSILEVKGLYR